MQPGYAAPAGDNYNSHFLSLLGGGAQPGAQPVAQPGVPAGWEAYLSAYAAPTAYGAPQSAIPGYPQLAAHPHQALWDAHIAQQTQLAIALAAQAAQNNPEPQVPQIHTGTGHAPNVFIGSWTGTINEFDEAKGFGFIYCEEAKEKGFRPTIFFNKRNMGTCKPGDMVNFTAVEDDQKRLMAQNLIYIQDGIVVDYKTRKGEHKESQKGDDIGEFEGSVAAVPENGLQRIRCDKLLEMGWEWDAVIDKNEGADYEFGDQVKFTAFETNSGRLRAKNVAITESSYIGAFVGDIKTFNERTGYGFILCDEVKAMGYQDVFVHNVFGGCPEIGQGDKVSFQCYLSLKKQPQAKKVIIIESTKPKPQVRAIPLCAEDQAFVDSLKRPANAMWDAKGENGEVAKGKGKGKKGKGEKGEKGDGKPAAKIPLGLALMLERQKRQKIAEGLPDDGVNPWA